MTAPSDSKDYVEIRPRDLADLALTCGQVAFLFYTRIAQTPRFSDDAHIHFRHALNLVLGHGMVFNPGEWVLGTTSPAWVLLLAAVHWVVRIPVSLVAEWTNFGIELGVMLMTLAWFRRAGLGVAARHLASLVLLCEPWRMFYGCTGLEMSFFILAVMLVLEFLHRRWWAAAGCVLGVIGWIRPEGAMVWTAGVGAVLAVALHARRASGDPAEARRQLAGGVKSYLVACALAAAIAALLTYCYGSPIPHSLTAKSSAPWYQKGGGLSHVFFFINLGNLTPAYMITGFQAAWGPGTDNFMSVLMALVQVSVMALGAVRLWGRGEQIIAVGLPLYLLGYYLFHSILQPMIFHWYYIPYYAAALFLGCVGWHALIQLCAERFAARKTAAAVLVRRARGPALGLVLLLSLCVQLYQGGYYELYSGERLREMAACRFPVAEPWEREWLYIRFAGRMNRIIRDDSKISVGCMEIGVFGYYYNGHVLDAFGLVSPEALEVPKPEVEAALPKSCRIFPYNVWMTYKPEFAMSDWRWVPRMPAEFQAEYEVIEWEDIPLGIFARKDVYRTINLPDTKIAAAR